MHVLERPASYIGGSDAEIGGHGFVPPRRQFRDLELVFEKLVLRLKTEHYMQRIRDLVGFDADVRRLHLAYRAIHLFRVHIRRVFAKGLFKFWEKVLPKTARTSNQILPHAGLRLVNTQRGATGERRALKAVG